MVFTNTLIVTQLVKILITRLLRKFPPVHSPTPNVCNIHFNIILSVFSLEATSYLLNFDYKTLCFLNILSLFYTLKVRDKFPYLYETGWPKTFRIF